MKRIFVLFLLLFLCATSAAPSFAENRAALVTDNFAVLPVLHEGRLKPLDTLARTELLKFSTKDTLDGVPAIVWLAETVFNPGDAVDTPVFRIDNADTRHRLGLEERKIPLYAFSELTAGLEKTRADVAALEDVLPKDRAENDKALITVHENAFDYTVLLRSFSAVLPLNITVPPLWAKKAGLKDGEPVTFAALVKIQPELDETVRGILKKKGDNPKTYTPEEQSTALLGLYLQTVAKAGEGNNLVKVIPTVYADKKLIDGFAAPWELYNDGKMTPVAKGLLGRWAELATAWRNKDAQAWSGTLAGINEDYFYSFTSGDYSSFSLSLEAFYNRVAPFTVTIFTYAAAMLFALFSLSVSATKRNISYRLAFVFLVFSIGVQAAGLLTRIELTGRPPVGTLYESLLFVGLMAPLIALFLEIKAKNKIGLLIAGMTGAVVGMLALSMAGEGDTMKMLGAVLNTRFWLATHVLCITVGYGWCLVTSVLAHLLLIGRVTGRIEGEQGQSLRKTVMTLALFSLLFTTVGTILGGIWADQSWGRFWGWDPKENGALLIVLWLAWFIHGRISAHFNDAVFLSGLGFLSVIVAVAWIGVNLLGVGLHSYGFIEGVFWGLGLFTLAEILLLGTLLRGLALQDKRHEA